MDPVQRARDLGLEYLAGRATSSQRQELERLLQESPAAADAFAQLGRLEADLTALFSEETDRRREAAVLEAIERHQRRRLWLGRGLRMALAASLLVLAGGALFWWLGQRDDSPAANHVVLAGQILVAGAQVVSLRDGDRLQVAGPVAAILRLADGSRARLQPDSQAILHGAGEGHAQRFELLQGEGRFEVRPGGAGFEVDTPVGRVAALGTEFDVKLTTSEREEDTMSESRMVLAVMVLTGLVQVEVGGERHRLGAGERGVFGQREREPGRRAAPRVISGAVVEVKGSKLTVSLRRRENPGEETFEVGKGVKVLVDGKPGKLADLARGTLVRLEKDEKDALVRILAEGPTFPARFKAFADGKITLGLLDRGQEEKEQVLPVPADLRVISGREKLKPTDLKPGMRILAKLSVDKKSVVVVLLAPERRPEGAPTLHAEIKTIDAKVNTITLAGPRGGNDRTLLLGQDVKVSIDGKPAKPADLKPGSSAVLTLDRDSRTVREIAVGRVRVSRPGPRPTWGTVAEIKGTRLALLVSAGRGEPPVEENINVAEAKVFVDGKPGRLADLATGTIVQVEKNEKGAAMIVRAEGPVVSGTVKSVANGSITLVGNAREGADGPTYEVAADVKVLIGRKEGKLADVQAGMQVGLKLSVDRKRVLLIRSVPRRGEQQ
jgi:ferric-dicitrate binding protein FerR (iron transport regulator)